MHQAVRRAARAANLTALLFLGILNPLLERRGLAQAVLVTERPTVSCPPAVVGYDDAVLHTTEVRVTTVNKTQVCEVIAMLRSSVRIRLAVPLTGWNDKFVFQGCSGSCGTLKFVWCEQALARGYACATTNMGHEGDEVGWAWARSNPAAVLNFSVLSTHAATNASKALLGALTKRPPKRSYFVGCSTGGQQGLTEAQDYPDDFDGIIAGAPAVVQAGAVRMAWNVRAATNRDGTPILGEAALRLLHKSIVRGCDMNDGMRDGLIGDPRTCGVEPEVLRCAPGSRGPCLTENEIVAVRKIYDGPRDADGKPIGPDYRTMKGSELNWIGYFTPHGTSRAHYEVAQLEYFRHFAFFPATDENFSVWDSDLARAYSRSAFVEALRARRNPDLRRFKARGGKLLGFQGWDDPYAVPESYIDYFQTTVSAMGSLQGGRDFFRLFMIPGLKHCSPGLSGADHIDYLGTLDRWVESGRPPDQLIGYAIHWGNGVPDRNLSFPPPAKMVRFVRSHPAFGLSEERSRRKRGR